MVDIKSTSNAAWWIKNPSRTWAQKQRKQSTSTSFCQDMADLFRYMSLHGYSHLLDSEFILWEKLIWLAVHTTTLVALLTVLSFTWEEFVARYIAINLHDPIYPVQNVPFPAVSICSNNRISQQEAAIYANELHSVDPANRSADYFLRRIYHFTDFYHKYNSNDNDYDDFSNFQAFLDTFGTADNETFYDTRRIMQRLTPKCEHIIRHCTLAGVDIPCFSKKAFQNSLTVYGPCCTFNLEDSYRKRSIKESYINSELGLTVILNISRSNDSVSILNIDGYVVVVHSPSEFADIASGGSQEVFPTRGEESFLAIRARIVDTDESLRSFHPKFRNCYFDNEAATVDMLYRGAYSFTNCITKCRIRSIMALCRCLPFYMPLEMVNTTRNVIYCTLQHVSCMLRYNYKWRNVLTQRDPIPGLEREMEEALYCPECLPSCDDVQYQVSLMSLPTDRFRASVGMKQLNLSIARAADISVLRIFYGDPHAQYYRRLVENTWFEALSTVGNFTSIFIGFSMVALLEVSYFIVKYAVIAGKKFVQNNRDQNIGQEREKFDVSKLYILP